MAKSKNLAMAFNLKQRSKKKMADGGKVPSSSASPTPNPTPDPNSAMGQGLASIRGAFKAKGGMIHEPDCDCQICMDANHMAMNEIPPDGLTSRSAMSARASEDQRRDYMYSGGEVEDYGAPEDDYDMWKARRSGSANPTLAESHFGMSDEDDMITEIMQRRKKMYGKEQMLANGGMVDLDHNSMEQKNDYYSRNEDAVLKENYDEDMKDMSQPWDSNEEGDARESDEEDEHDDISQMRKKMKSKKS